MTKLEELKAAYEAATPGEWGEQDGIIWGESCVDNSDESYLVCDLAGDPISAVNEQDVQNGHFITLAHNLMPALLKAASLVLECEALVREYPYIHQECKKVLEELK